MRIQCGRHAFLLIAMLFNRVTNLFIAMIRRYGWEAGIARLAFWYLSRLQSVGV